MDEQIFNTHHNLDYETIGANAVGDFWVLMTIGGVFGLILLKIMDSEKVLKIFTGQSIICLGLVLFSNNANMSLYTFQLSGLFLSVMYLILSCHYLLTQLVSTMGLLKGY